MTDNPAAPPSANPPAVLREAATMAERLPIADRYRHHSQLADAWDAGRDAAVQVLRRLADKAQQPGCDHDSQVIDHEGAQYWACLKCGTNLGRLTDEAQQPPAPLTPCTCRQAVHTREHTNRPIPGCPWCTSDQTQPDQETRRV